jgi:hypothetical protein
LTSFEGLHWSSKGAASHGRRSGGKGREAHYCYGLLITSCITKRLYENK